MKLEIVKLFRSIEVFARIICARAGISVTFSGTTASTDGKSIRLPVFAKVLDDLVVAKLLFLGFILHESFHILWSDFSFFTEYVRSHKNRKPALNILEDIRIEYKGGFWVVGFKKVLAQMCEYLVCKGDFFKAPTQESTPVFVCDLYLLYSLRFNVLGQLAFKQLAVDSKILLEQKIGFQAVSEIDQVVSKIVDTQSTQDVGLIVDELFVILDKLAEENQNQDPSQDQNSSNDQPPDEPEDDSGQNNGPSESEESDGDITDDENSSNTKEDPLSGDPSEESSGSNKPAQWGVNKDGSLDPSVEENWDVGDVISGAINGQEKDQEEAAKQMTYVDKDLPCVFGSMPSERVKNERDLASISAARSITNSLSFQLRALLEAKKSVQHSRRTTGIRVGHSSLAKVAVGDLRVFQKTTRVDGVNTAVFILMDVSDSMNENTNPNDRNTPKKIEVARKSVLALSLALDSIPDVKVGVIAYPQAHHNQKTRTLDQYMNDLVEMGEPVQLRSKAIMTVRAVGSTPTAQALLYARSKMDSADVERRVILVITDGEPDHNQRLVDALKEVEKDTDVIGIGIGTDSVSRTFRNFSVIHKAEDLTNVVFRKVKQVLLAA